MEFAILGPCEVRNSGQLIELRRGLPPALLTLLLVSRRTALSADVIADRLWGENLPANPRNAVQQLVGYLRRALGPAGASLLVTRASRYALMAEDEDVGVRVFERLVDQAVEQASDGTARGARDALTAADAALALWRGDPLADIAAHEWAEPEVARLEESALRAREARVTAMLTLGHHADAISVARSVADAHPLREQVHADLVLALYRAGRQRDALEALSTVRRTLAAELGLDPGPRLQALEQRVLAQDHDLQWVAPPDMDTDTSGADRAKAAPERLEPVPRLSPATSLIGRDDEIDRLLQALDRARVLTLTGPGGTGKTRIAAELAGRQRSRPVWFVDFSVLSDEELVGATAARTVGAVHGPDQDPADAMIAQLRDRPGLLVLDNCEHVVDAAGRLAATLMHGCPDLVQVTTSRRPLRVSGEMTWPVPPLQTPDSADVDPSEVSELPAVRLFVERATAVRPDFLLTENNAADVAAIVCSLDGLPLAIELAAAHADVLSVASIRRRLLDRFELLETDVRDAPARQRTLRAVIDSSASLLTDAERHFFVRLGVFAGSFDLDAAAAVTGSFDAFRTTASLVRQSLVVSTGAGRYRLLESVREYAAQALSREPDVGEVQSRHCEHFIALMTQAHDGIRADGQDEWLAQINDSLPDFRAALNWSLGGAAPARGALLAAKSNWFWTLEGMLAEADRWLAQAESVPLDDASVRAELLLAIGRIAAPRGDIARALAACAESAELSRRLGNARACADALVTLGIAQWARGDLAGAASSHDEAARLGETAGDTFVRDTALALRARTAVDADEPDAALRIDEAIVRARRSREKHRIGLALSQRARYALLSGDGQTAYIAGQESLSNWQHVGYREGEANALNLLARASTVLGRPDEAEGFALRALHIAAAIGHRGGLCQGLESLAGALHLRGHDERAALLLAVAAAERRQSAIPAAVAEATHLSALAAAVLKQAGPAAGDAERRAAYLSADDLLDLIEAGQA